MTNAQTLNGLTLSEAHRLFDYDPETGIVRNRVSRGSRSRAGAAVGSRNKGHLYVQINGTNISVHRLAWFWYMGWVPEEEIDHINGVRDDNRLRNLREASAHQNAMNQMAQTGRSSVFKGVSWHKPMGKWSARTTVCGSRTTIGYHEDARVAAAWYNAAALASFGPFAKLNNIPGFGELALVFPDGRLPLPNR